MQSVKMIARRLLDRDPEINRFLIVWAVCHSDFRMHDELEREFEGQVSEEAATQFPPAWSINIQHGIGVDIQEEIKQNG